MFTIGLQQIHCEFTTGLQQGQYGFTTGILLVYKHVYYRLTTGWQQVYMRANIQIHIPCSYRPSSGCLMEHIGQSVLEHLNLLQALHMRPSLQMQAPFSGSPKIGPSLEGTSIGELSSCFPSARWDYYLAQFNSPPLMFCFGLFSA